MRPFHTLTVRGRARRLRALALNTLTCYNLDVARLRLVTNDMNGIFRLDTRDGGKYILRVTAPEGAHRFHDVAAEMDWLPALRAAFQDGYRRHTPWPERHPGEIDSFIAARAVGLANFVLNDPNPEWKEKAAGFIERVETRLQRLMCS